MTQGIDWKLDSNQLYLLENVIKHVASACPPAFQARHADRAENATMPRCFVRPQQCPSVHCADDRIASFGVQHFAVLVQDLRLATFANCRVGDIGI